jgi:hypothetical protein
MSMTTSTHYALLRTRITDIVEVGGTIAGSPTLRSLLKRYARCTPTYTVRPTRRQFALDDEINRYTVGFYDTEAEALARMASLTSLDAALAAIEG